MNIKEIINVHKKKLIIAAGIVIIIIIVATGLFIIKGSDKKATADVSSTETTESEIEETQGESTVSNDIASADSEDPQPQNIQNETGVQVDIGNLDVVGNDFEVSGVTYGIDVSKWQGTIDWDKVKAAGIEFAMIRIGYRTEGNGTICKDSYAEYNLQKAVNAGIKVGVYFFSTAVSTDEAKEEAAWVTDLVSKYKITYPVVYNCEGYNISDSRMYSLSSAERTNNALAFLNYVAGAGYTPMFYANSSELSGSSDWNTNSISSKYKIWVAQYPNTAYTADSKSSYSGNHAMWQYTNKGVVNGISGYVDMNIAYFGYSSVADAKVSGTVEEATAPTQAVTPYDPYTTTVNEQVTAKDETNLRTVASTTDDSTIYYLLKNGETVTRIAIGTNGWSKVVYNGMTLYAKSSYLTTDIQPATEATTTYDPLADKNFTEVNEQVTAKIETNLRTAPSTTVSEAVYLLKNGEYVTRTGIDSVTGWSRVVYNGQTLYAVSSNLTN